ncbi:MAG: hypothetical protein ABIN01_18820 [Ferruginibacter sp.]
MRNEGIKQSVIFVFIFFNITTVYSQNLVNNEAFFKSKLSVYRQWLQNTNLNKIINADTVIVGPEKIFLKLSIQDRYNWERLVHITDSSYHLSIANTLFNQFVFEMDLKRSQGEINVEAVDVTIIIKNENGKTNIDFWNKMGTGSSNVDIPIDGLKDLNNINTFVSNKSVEVIKTNLQKELYTYFKKFKAKLENYHFELIYQLNNTLIFEVSNIVDAVLNEGYFEHLQFNFHFTKQKEKTEVKYEFFGKYGAGILWAPQDSRFSNMLPKYEDRYKLFNFKISNEIGRIIN